MRKPRSCARHRRSRSARSMRAPTGPSPDLAEVVAVRRPPRALGHLQARAPPAGGVAAVAATQSPGRWARTAAPAADRPEMSGSRNTRPIARVVEAAAVTDLVPAAPAAVAVEP